MVDILSIILFNVPRNIDQLFSTRNKSSRLFILSVNDIKSVAYLGVAEEEKLSPKAQKKSRLSTFWYSLLENLFYLRIILMSLMLKTIIIYQYAHL